MEQDVFDQGKQGSGHMGPNGPCHFLFSFLFCFYSKRNAKLLTFKQ